MDGRTVLRSNTARYALGFAVGRGKRRRPASGVIAPGAAAAAAEPDVSVAAPRVGMFLHDVAVQEQASGSPARRRG